MKDTPGKRAEDLLFYYYKNPSNFNGLKFLLKVSYTRGEPILKKHCYQKAKKPRTIVRGFAVGACRLELVVHAGAHDVRGEVDVVCDRAASSAPHSNAAEIHVEIFDLGSPVRSKRTLEARTDIQPKLVSPSGGDAINGGTDVAEGEPPVTYGMKRSMA